MLRAGNGSFFMIEIKNLTYFYGSKGNRKKVLSDISLKLIDGEFVSILGPNGAGKSTLLKIIAGLLRDFEGNLFFDAQSISHLRQNEIARLVSYLPQSYSYKMPFSVRQIIMMGRYPHSDYLGLKIRFDKEYFVKIIELLDIGKLLDKPIISCSGGEAQKVLLARSLFQDTPILLFDEPSTHLDIQNQITFFKTLKKLNLGKSKTIIIVSHDLELAANFSDKVVLLERGNVRQFDSPANAITPETIMNTFGVNADVELSEQINIRFNFQ
ncbi:MAG: ABC transporter ATP-binding protein [Ignavibacteriales bacterium]|nr:ABC transporter ATP-binding protein [Ignavibacteriales bacterium]